MKPFYRKYNYLLFIITACFFPYTGQSQNTWYTADTTIIIRDGLHRIYLRNKINAINETECELKYTCENDTYSMHIKEKNFYLLHDTLIKTVKSKFLLLALAGEPGDFRDYMLIILRNSHLTTYQFRIDSDKHKELNHSAFRLYLIRLIPALSEEKENIAEKLILLMKPD